MRALHIQLIPELKEMVEKGEVQLQAALRVQKIATHNGTIENKTAVALASEMKYITSVQQWKLEEIVAKLDKILEAGGKVKKVARVEVAQAMYGDLQGIAGKCRFAR